MIIVDYSQTAISSLMADLKGRTDSEISLPMVRHMIINTIRSYKVKYGAEYGDIVIACDSRKYWRREIFQYYKAKRKSDREKSGFDWHSIFEALNQVKTELAEHFPYPVIEVDTAEADDVIASLVYWSQENELIMGVDEIPQPILILSGDRDFVQLQRYQNVKQYSPIERKWLKPESTPDQIVMDHAICGDVGDGVPNFLSDDDIFVREPKARQKSIRKKDLAVWRNLTLKDWETTPHYNRILRNLDLVDLRRIPENLQLACINSYKAQRGVKDRSGLLNYFIAHKMKLLIEHITEF
jgi:5'-3' exonuclease, N-terminal resolvase-like domain/T4 RNase H, C terminal